MVVDQSAICYGRVLHCLLLLAEAPWNLAAFPAAALIRRRSTPFISSSTIDQLTTFDVTILPSGSEDHPFQTPRLPLSRRPRHNDGITANNAFSRKSRYFRPRSIHQLRSIGSTYSLRLTSLCLFKIHLRTKFISQSEQHDICPHTAEQPANFRRPESPVCRLSAEQWASCGSLGRHNGYQSVRPAFFASSSAILRQPHVCQLRDVAH